MAALHEYTSTHTKLEVALLELANLTHYEAIEWHNGAKPVNALSWRGSGDPVVSHDPDYDSYEAFEGFVKFLREYVAAALKAIEIAK